MTGMFMLPKHHRRLESITARRSRGYANAPIPSLVLGVLARGYGVLCCNDGRRDSSYLVYNCVALLMAMLRVAMRLPWWTLHSDFARIQEMGNFKGKSAEEVKSRPHTAGHA